MGAHLVQAYFTGTTSYCCKAGITLTVIQIPSGEEHLSLGPQDIIATFTVTHLLRFSWRLIEAQAGGQPYYEA